MSRQPKILPLEFQAGERRIGQILLTAGKLSAEGIELVLRHQRERGIRFGEAAQELGLVSPDEVSEAIADQLEHQYLRRRRELEPDPATTVYDAFSPERELFRSVRNQLMARWHSDSRRILAVVSPRPGDGRSFVVARLAQGFARFGQRTLVIDGNLRHPGLPAPFATLPDTEGLTGVLLGRAREEAIRRVPGHEQLFLLPAGPLPRDPLRLLSRERLHDLLHGLVKTFDVVLVDTPAAAAGPEFQALGAWTQAALLVARRGRTRFAEAAAIKEALGTVRCQVAGAVINDH